MGWKMCVCGYPLPFPCSCLVSPSIAVVIPGRKDSVGANGSFSSRGNNNYKENLYWEPGGGKGL